MVDKCPKCEGKMIEGVLQLPYGILPLVGTRFIPKNKPQASRFRLLDLGRKINKAYCCEKCGYVEQYATN